MAGVGVLNNLIGLAMLTAVAAGCGALGLVGGTGIIEATRTAPGTVDLLVASCNQNPFVANVEQTDPGTYEVLVRTELGNNGEACADQITIDVDPDHPTVAIIDQASGQTFDLLGTGQPAPVGLNGVWRMTTVDNGHPVTAGQTTAEIPEITIEAGEESGVIEGNFGCNHLSIEVAFAAGTLTGRPETLEGTEELCAIPDGSDRLVLTERTVLDLLSGKKPVEMYLSGDHLEIGTLDTNAVFERVAP
ncbi:MAG: hypothetical protein ACRBK7_02825 [Acidimicrobiales bacterium]